MIFTVTKWNPMLDYHECMDTHGNKHWLDLQTASCVDLNGDEFVGKTFEGPDDRIIPYVSIAHEFWEKTE